MGSTDKLWTGRRTSTEILYIILVEIRTCSSLVCALVIAHCVALCFLWRQQWNKYNYMGLLNTYKLTSEDDKLTCILYYSASHHSKNQRKLKTRWRLPINYTFLFLNLVRLIDLSSVSTKKKAPLLCKISLLFQTTNNPITYYTTHVRAFVGNSIFAQTNKTDIHKIKYSVSKRYFHPNVRTMKATYKQQHAYGLN